MKYLGDKPRGTRPVPPVEKAVDKGISDHILHRQKNKLIICPCPEQDYEINISESDMFHIDAIVKAVGSKDLNEVQNTWANQDEVKNTKNMGL